MKKSTWFILFFLVVSFSFSQELDQKTFKDFAGSTIVSSQVRSERNKAILRGTEATKNREFILENYTGIQPSVYPAWDGGFWPQKRPLTIEKIRFSTQQFDELVNWGVKNNYHILHHCLFFPNKYFPKWFWKSNYSKKELEKLLIDFITAVLTSNNNKDKVDAFNLINEIFAMGKSGKYRDYGSNKEDCKWMKMGFEKDLSGLKGKSKINDSHPIFVRKVFETAAKLTDATLEIRDFNIAFGGKKADGLYQLIKHLKNSGVKVDAVGFQCHLNVNTNYNYTNLYNNIRRFIDLGVEVYITELDVGMNLWSTGKKNKKVSDLMKSPEDWNLFFKKQNEIYYQLVKTSREAGVSLISDWGFRDDIPYGNWRKNQKAWMLNKDYSKKGAYYAVLKALFDTEEYSKF